MGQSYAIQKKVTIEDSETLTGTNGGDWYGYQKRERKLHYVTLYDTETISGVCVCVLTGIWNKQYDLIVRLWSSKPWSGVATVLDSDTYCYVILP